MRVWAEGQEEGERPQCRTAGAGQAVKALLGPVGWPEKEMVSEECHPNSLESQMLVSLIALGLR